MAIKIALGGLLALLLHSGSVSATYFHVNRGCISYESHSENPGDHPLCAPDSVYVSFGNLEIYSQIPDTRDELVVPGCFKSLNWPSEYGDVYWGADDCLYDSQGQQINGGQCCGGGTGNTDQIYNPYNG